MKIKLNSFAAGISVVLSFLLLSVYFFSATVIEKGLYVFFYPNILHNVNEIYSFLFLAALILAPLCMLVFTFCCRKCALPALLLPLCCCLAAIGVSFFYDLKTNSIDTASFVIMAVFATLIALCIIFYKNASKFGLCVMFFCVAAIILGGFISKLLLQFCNATILIYWIIMFLSLGALSLCLEPKQKHFELPSLLEAEQPEVSVKIESVSLSQTLDALLQNYNSGKISKEEYEALKRETLWKV